VTMQEERLRHLLHQAAPNPTATIDPQDIERRAGGRHRARIVVTALTIAALAGACAATLVTVTGSSNSEQRITATPGPSEPRPTIYTGVGTIIKTTAGPAQLCLGVQFTAATGSFPLAKAPTSQAPATCPGGVTLRGLVLDQLPAGSTKNGVTETQPLKVTGTYQAGIFTLARQPQKTKDRPTEPWSTSYPLPCAAPAGGWSYRPMTDAQQKIVTDYNGTRPDTWGGGWLLNNQRIFVTAFTRDLNSARQALRSLSNHVCVTKVSRTYLDMQAVAATLKPTPAEMNQLHININGASVDEAHSQLVIGVVLADEPIETYVAAHFAPGLVRLKSFLTPVRR
jgi:hypothetical protein